jgi:hypothetical protein
MATTYRNIAQIVPTGTTYTDLYTVPAATSVVVSSIIICNQTATTGLVRVYLRSGIAAAGAGLSILGAAGPAAPSPSAFILYDVNIYAGSTLSLTLGVTATATEVFGVYSTINPVSFQLYGSVIT